MFTIAPETGWGMSGKDHIKDWNRVFGINDSKSAKNIKPLWDEMQKLIDTTENLNNESGDDYKRVKNEFKWFTWGSFNTGGYGHRLFFHWGFNVDIKQYPPLQDQVTKCLKDYAAKQLKTGKTTEIVEAECEQQKEAFYELLFKIQGERNKALIDKVVEVTGIPTTRCYANAVATILYDTHLLSDYSTTWTNALPEIRTLEYDIAERGFKKLLIVGESDKLELIYKELRQAIKNGRGRTQDERARNLINVTEKYLPEILNERFGKTLSEEKGIKITIPEQL
jgi:ElaB/YqjD/DUF883 family membrane-anchored ribosome-binding protein